MVRAILTPAQMSLFTSMQDSEQAHSLRLLHSLQQAGENDHDLLVAALLHDVGKSRYPLRLWERVVIVLTKAFFPQKVHQWGQGSVRGWQRPFVIAEQHAAWGAEMAAQVGASALSVALIRRHQDPPGSLDRTARAPHEERLLVQLQTVDNQS